MRRSFNLFAAVLMTAGPALAASAAPAGKGPSPKECLVVAFEDGWGAPAGAAAAAKDKSRPSKDACIRAGYWVKIQSDGSQSDAARLTGFAAAIQQERKAAQDHEDLAVKCFVLDAGGADKKEAEKAGCSNQPE